MSTPAFDFDNCGVSAPPAITDFALISNCQITSPLPPIYEPDDLAPYIPQEFASGGSTGIPCPDIAIAAEAAATAVDGDTATATVAVTEDDMSGSIGCAKSFLFSFDFDIPRGRPGVNGSNGSNGSCPNISLDATLTVLDPSADGSVVVVPGGTRCAPSFRFNFSVPRGERGSDGPPGPPGSQGPIGPIGPQGIPGVTTTVTDCADFASTLDLGEWVKKVTIGTNGFNRIYLDVESADLSVDLSDCGVQSITVGDSKFQRQIAELNLSRMGDYFAQYACDYLCSSSQGSDGPPDCDECTVYSLNVNGEEDLLLPLTPGQTWANEAGTAVLSAPPNGTCLGFWTVQLYDGADPTCSFTEDWDGLGCRILTLNGATSTECETFTVEVCCIKDHPGSSSSRRPPQGDCTMITGLSVTYSWSADCAIGQEALGPSPRTEDMNFVSGCTWDVSHGFGDRELCPLERGFHIRFTINPNNTVTFHQAPGQDYAGPGEGVTIIPDSINPFHFSYTYTADADTGCCAGDVTIVVSDTTTYGP